MRCYSYEKSLDENELGDIIKTQFEIILSIYGKYSS
jgi:hypothetical protein